MCEDHVGFHQTPKNQLLPPEVSDLILTPSHLEMSPSQIKPTNHLQFGQNIKWMFPMYFPKLSQMKGDGARSHDSGTDMELSGEYA